MDHIGAHLRVGELAEGLAERLHGALNVGLHHEVQVLDGAVLNLLEQLLQTDPLPLHHGALAGFLPVGLR